MHRSVCLVDVGVSVSGLVCFECVCVCVCVCVCLSEVLFEAGGSERLGSFNTTLIRDTHAHNRSKEALKAVGPPAAILLLSSHSVP